MGQVDERIGLSLARARKRRQLTQSAFGAPLGWSRQIVSLVETGRRRVTVPELFAASIVLRVPVTHLLEVLDPRRGDLLDEVLDHDRLPDQVGDEADARRDAVELVPGFTATPDQVGLALQDSEWTEDEERLLELVKQVLARAGEEEPSSVRTRLAAARLLVRVPVPGGEVIQVPDAPSVNEVVDALRRTLGQALKQDVAETSAPRKGAGK
jgi:transcriptional regulator with XRE-family HTH domain